MWCAPFAKPWNRSPPEGLEGPLTPVAPEGDDYQPSVTSALSDRVFDLAQSATRLRVQRTDLPELIEATAALQDVAITLADDSSMTTRMRDLADLQSGLDAQIQAAHNGLYLVTNPGRVTDWLGQPLPVRPQMALCRCGGS